MQDFFQERILGAAKMSQARVQAEEQETVSQAINIAFLCATSVNSVSLR